MGNFYVSFTARTADQKAVADALRKHRRHAFVAPAEGGHVVFYDEKADGQDDAVIDRLGQAMSRDLATTILAVMNHDDDVLFYWLYDNGRLVDHYNSFPGCFDDGSGGGTTPTGGDAARLVKAVGGGANAAEVEAILRTESGGGAYLFAVDRHAALLQRLGLPVEYGHTGFRYVEEDDDEIPRRDDFIDVS